MNRSPIFRTLLLCLVLVLGVAVAQSQTTNLLTNPGFEAPFVAVAGSTTSTVAQGWTAWSAQTGQNVQPEFYPASDTTNGMSTPRIHGGSDAQQYFTFFAPHIAGVYQHVTGVKPGDQLSFSIYAYIWVSSGDNASVSDGSGDLSFQVGIDPSGGTDPTNSAIVWSSPLSIVDQYAQHTVEATAAGAAVTVFARSTVNKVAMNNVVYLDDASLTVTGTGAVPPAATEQATEMVTAEVTQAVTQPAVVATTEVTTTEVATSEVTAPVVEVTEAVTTAIAPAVTAEVTEAATEIPTLAEFTQTPTEIATLIAPEITPVATAEVIEATTAPTATDTDTPTTAPTVAIPTDTPTLVPTVAIPTDTPTLVPPSPTPSDTPTEAPPTATPTEAPPTATPTPAPPTSTPTVAPPTNTPTPVPPTATIVPSPTLDTNAFPYLIPYTVQYGDTVSRIAARFGSTVQAIVIINQLDSAAHIKVTQQLMIPVPTPPQTPSPTPLPSETPIPVQAVQALPTFTETPIVVLPASTPEVGAQSQGAAPQTVILTTYVVRFGDSLSTIAAHFGIMTLDLARANGIVNPNLIYIGQVLRIPAAGQPTPTPTSVAPTPVPPAQQLYQVQPGDNLYRISIRFNVPIVALIEANGIFNANRIFVGQILIIP